jgi:hypothetical protein
VLPPPQLAPRLEARQGALALELAQLDGQIAEYRNTVQTLAIDEEALRAVESASAIHKQTVAELNAAEERLRFLKQRQSQLAETRDAVQRYTERVLAGQSDQPHAHLHDVHRPDLTPAPRRVLQVWAALSGAIALFAVGTLLVALPAYWLLWALALGLAFAIVEAAAEGRLINFLLSLAVVLALISALILIREFWRIVVVGSLAIIIAFVIRENIRELRGA